MDNVGDRAIAVMRMRLPYIDRGTLSQAWFSALDLARTQSSRDVPDAPSHAACRSEPPQCMRSARRAAAPALARTETFPVKCAERATNVVGDVAVRRARAYEGERGAAAPADRSRARTALAASLTVGMRGGRVQLLLRRDGGTIHLVALCAAGNIDLVRRALTRAQAHFHARGETLRAHARAIEWGG